MDILVLLVELMKLLAEVIFYVETSPSWWFSHGHEFVTVLLVSYFTYTVRVAADAVAFRLGFGLVELVVKLGMAWLPERWQRPAARVAQRGGGYRERLLLALKRWGYPGLFVAGLIPVPVLGAIGPAIYALERLHQPWYRFNNAYFACLLAGGFVKMTAFVIMFSP